MTASTVFRLLIACAAAACGPLCGEAWMCSLVFGVVAVPLAEVDCTNTGRSIAARVVTAERCSATLSAW